LSWCRASKVASSSWSGEAAGKAVGLTPSSAYSVAKAGLHALTHNLAIELANHQIRANAVAPAVVATPIYEAFVPPEKIEETLQSFNGFHPRGRVGTAQDLASAITFLCTSGCRNCTRAPNRTSSSTAVSAAKLAAIPSCSAARQTSAGSPTGSTAATSSDCRVRASSPLSWRR
jgi:NAD(P)-dependent dehydrogenase (short-subunit alcohol dehydrogenase family)